MNKLYNLIFNHIYPKLPFYKLRFKRIGKNSLICFPTKCADTSIIYIGNNSKILHNSRIQYFANKVNKNGRLFIGDNTYIMFDFSSLVAEDIIIGNDVLIASNVLITSESHSINPEDKFSYMSQDIIAKKVVIGDGVWIGEKSVILPGVSIGKKSIVGAMSVVTHSIPDYCIAVGNPAKVIKKYNFHSHCWEQV